MVFTGLTDPFVQEIWIEKALEDKSQKGTEPLVSDQNDSINHTVVIVLPGQLLPPINSASQDD